MNPLLQIRGAREKRRIMRIVSPILADTDLSNSGFDNCNDLVRALKQNGIDAIRIIVTPKPEGRDLGHITRERQYGHEALLLPVGVLDPLYPRKILPLDKYLKEVYRPEDGTELVVTLQPV